MTTIRVRAVPRVLAAIFNVRRFNVGRNGPLLTWLMALNRLYVRLWCRNASNGSSLPRKGAAILIANHTSPLDPALLQAGTDRPIRFMMAREYYEVRWFGWLYRLLGCIPVNRTGRDTAAAKSALRALSHGEVIGIFPEGKINLDGHGLIEPQLGAALLALRSRATVVPAYLSGAPIGRTMIKPFFQPCRTEVKYGPPLDLSPYYGRERNRDVLAEVGRLMMSRLAELGGVDDRWKVAEDGHGGAAA